MWSWWVAAGSHRQAPCHVAAAAACCTTQQQQPAASGPHLLLPPTPVCVCVLQMKPETRLSLSWDCDEQLFRKELEDSDDMRLSIRLFNKCLGDKKQFCSDVPPGHALAKQCLEEHREELSDGCRWGWRWLGCGRGKGGLFCTASSYACVQQLHGWMPAPACAGKQLML